MQTLHDNFRACLVALPTFMKHHDPTFMESVEWVLRQCGWCYISNTEWKILEAHYEHHCAD